MSFPARGRADPRGHAGPGSDGRGLSARTRRTVFSVYMTVFNNCDRYSIEDRLGIRTSYLTIHHPIHVRTISRTDGINGSNHGFAASLAPSGPGSPYPRPRVVSGALQRHDNRPPGKVESITIETVHGCVYGWELSSHIRSRRKPGPQQPTLLGRTPSGPPDACLRAYQASCSSARTSATSSS
jgi:hypothetical protein